MSLCADMLVWHTALRPVELDGTMGPNSTGITAHAAEDLLPFGAKYHAQGSRGPRPLLACPAAHAPDPEMPRLSCPQAPPKMGCAGSAQEEHGEADAGAGGYDDQGGEEYQPLTQDEVNARIQCCDKTQHFTLAETGITLRYAYLSQRGYYGSWTEQIFAPNFFSLRYA